MPQLIDEKVDHIEHLLAQQFKETAELIEEMIVVVQKASPEISQQVLIGTAYMSGIAHGLQIAKNSRVAPAVEQVMQERVLRGTGGMEGLHFAGIADFLREAEKYLRGDA